MILVVAVGRAPGAYTELDSATQVVSASGDRLCCADLALARKCGAASARNLDHQILFGEVRHGTRQIEWLDGRPAVLRLRAQDLYRRGYDDPLKVVATTPPYRAVRPAKS